MNHIYIYDLNKYSLATSFLVFHYFANFFKDHFMFKIVILPLKKIIFYCHQLQRFKRKRDSEKYVRYQFN